MKVPVNVTALPTTEWGPSTEVAEAPAIGLAAATEYLAVEVLNAEVRGVVQCATEGTASVLVTDLGVRLKEVVGRAYSVPVAWAFLEVLYRELDLID